VYAAQNLEKAQRDDVGDFAKRKPQDENLNAFVRIHKILY